MHLIGASSGSPFLMQKLVAKNCSYDTPIGVEPYLPFWIFRLFSSLRHT